MRAKTTMNLNRATRKDVSRKQNSMLDARFSVEFTDGNETLTVTFYKESVCGTLSNGSDFSMMNNRDMTGTQRVTWNTCASGVLLAARWFLQQHNDAVVANLQLERKQRTARYKAREKHSAGLKGGTGGTGSNAVPLFAMPSAA